MDIKTENQTFQNLLPDPELIECERLFAKARAYYDVGKIAKAASLLAKLIKQNPRFGKACNLLGFIFQTIYHDSEQAEKYYLAAIEISPKWRHTYLNYVYLLRAKNRFAEAQEYLKKWAAFGVDEENIAFETAILLEMQGKTEEALQFYQRAALLCVSTANYRKYSEEIVRCKQKLEAF